MAKKSKTNQPKINYPIGKQVAKQQAEKEPDFYHKHKSTIWTVIVLVVLTFFFIVNNTRKVPEQGSYPPNYLKGNSADETSE
jgi:beta-lactamase regulating signal transducer with metallopeptidase domain